MACPFSHPHPGATIHPGLCSVAPESAYQVFCSKFTRKSMGMFCGDHKSIRVRFTIRETIAMVKALAMIPGYYISLVILAFSIH